MNQFAVRCIGKNNGIGPPDIPVDIWCKKILDPDSVFRGFTVGQGKTGISACAVH
jgi:hypothetical protein